MKKQYEKKIVEVELSLDGDRGGENPDIRNQVFAFQSAAVQEYLVDLLFMREAHLMGQEIIALHDQPQQSARKE